MASAGRFMRQSQNFARHVGNSLKSNQNKFSSSAIGNLKKTARCSMVTKALGGQQQSALMNAASKMEMRQLQKSVAVMSLSSKVSACMDICVPADSDVSESSEDAEDVCSQPGHKHKRI
ncbi:uncharacterized protein [Clytia hemisphaerica]|eukprot:TCONS_00023242-protein